MPKKPTRTQKTITNINRYIKNVARTFGTSSKEYQQIVQQLHGKELKLNDTNGVITIQNTKENRRKHRTIRAIANKRTSMRILKRPYEKIRKEINKKTANIIRGERIRNFYQWYGKLKKELADLITEVYTLEEACEKDGISFEVYKAFKDDIYRIGKWEEFYNKSGQNIEPSKSALDEWLSEVDDSDIDENTGENYNFDNEYYEGFESGVEYD